MMSAPNHKPPMRNTLFALLATALCAQAPAVASAAQISYNPHAGVSTPPIIKTPIDPAPSARPAPKESTLKQNIEQKIRAAAKTLHLTPTYTPPEPILLAAHTQKVTTIPIIEKPNPLPPTHDFTCTPHAGLSSETYNMDILRNKKIRDILTAKTTNHRYKLDIKSM